MLEQTLKDFGFNVREAEIFSSLVEAGPQTVQELSRLLGMPRATLYGMLSGLSDRGFVISSINKSTTVYSASPPSSFSHAVAKEREALTAKEKYAEKLTEMLTPMLSAGAVATPKLQLFQGKKKVEEMLYRYLPEWRKSYERLGHWTMWGYQDHTFVEQYRRWHEYAWAVRDGRESIKLFSNIEGVEQQKKEGIVNREIRPLPKGIEFSSSIWIHGDYIVLGMTRKKPHYSMLIIDQILAENLRSVFQMLWMASFPK
jgi:sugar-specific transcriptional regulator TrmB